MDTNEQTKSEQSDSPWYAVTRRQTVDETIYVRAESQAEAMRKVRGGDYELDPINPRFVRESIREATPTDPGFDPREL